MIDHRNPQDRYEDFDHDDNRLGIDPFEEQGHQSWMRRAIQLALAAQEQDEVPVGAIVVHQNRIIGSGYNQREQLKDPTAHAEMIALTQAAATLDSWRLIDCTLYVTLEPCPMCAGAIIQSRLPLVVYGARDPKAGAVHSLYQLLQDTRLNHQCEVVADVLGNECGYLLTEFFEAKRKQGKK